VRSLVGKRRVGVLMGGLSAEREVSLKTGAGVMEALRCRGYRPLAIDVGMDIARDLRRRRIEIAFVALHGRGGEDGSIQGLLESMNVPYTGSGVLSSALAMDKKYSKLIFSAGRLPTAPFTVLREVVGGRRWPLPEVRPPVVVKPTREGSTIGISLVKRLRDLPPALTKAFRYGAEVMVEKYIPGRELTVGVLGDRALPVVEVRAAGGFYDYQAKYGSTTTRYLVPAPLPANLSGRLRKMAVAAHRALDCRGATRVDFRLNPEGKPFILEVNTIPGMTQTSLLPKAAREDGMEFDELVEWILCDAVGGEKVGEGCR
jgi:D-alanine-D-alanine ligase